MKRGWTVIGAALPVLTALPVLVALTVLTALAGCGRVDAGSPDLPPAASTVAEPAQPGPTLPPGALAACVQTADRVDPPAPRPSATTPTTPGVRGSSAPSEQDRAEAFRRNQAANKAYRNRSVLADAVYRANLPCAERVHAELALRGAAGQYDAATIQAVLTKFGLTSATARPPGRLDQGNAHGGLLFAGWTGQACVFGEHGPAASEVYLGGLIADGGCLPAPD